MPAPSQTISGSTLLPAEEVFPTLEENILVDGFHIVIDLERSHGSTMVDALEGKEYIDCYTFFATLPIGHNHPGLDDPEFQETLMRAAIENPANSDVYSREFASFVRTFREIAVPDEFRYLFFVAGGALAVENAMKAAFDWKARKNREQGIEGGGDRILHFREAFHGRSGYTLSVTNTDPNKTALFPKFDWPRVTNPKVTYPIDEETAAAAEAAAVAEIERAFDSDPHGIAAILIEPIQGEGGDNHFRPEFLLELRRIADERDALLIFDEVQTGMGTTGAMWAFQALGVTPDLVAFGKKTQVCGMMSTRRIDEVDDNVFHLSSRINSTWGGNLVDMIRCARYLEIIRDEDLVDNAARVGAYFLDRLAGLEREFPGTVSNARGLGLFLAFDLPDGATRDAIRTSCWEAGLATLTCGPRSLRFRPSLIFSEADVDRAIEILRPALSDVV
ncbi:MAG: L-lysine 6-transaminase [marine benthic group bacterium]|jgi:L-lysine 6-transaminase|nr:L-lysine 6-transaminase [Gemmatimonadota bacterium]MCL7936561.1 L-lysine 6-transaminase [Gemmatimonadota bacterium]MCL7965091.1 L-lysine 6-transaminase [Gemmatimonadota bacterium]MCL7968266.1 L-lysine 6-transaminase [Gemmatimonadota bacterium]MCL7974716.1 L-lysine 6-transaminase [Gemmatimonadota bacterium]